MDLKQRWMRCDEGGMHSNYSSRRDAKRYKETAAEMQCIQFRLRMFL